MNFFQEIYYFYLAQEARYQIVIFLVLLLLVLSIVLVSIVLNERSKKNSQEEREKKVRSKVDPVLQEIAFSEHDSTEFKEAVKQINKIINSKGNEKANYHILDELVIYYHNNLGGESAKRLEDLYRQTGLKKYQLDLLKRGEWHEKAKAISDLSSMRMAETLFEILQYTDDENIHVRNEAQYAAVKLGGKKALSFLDDLSTPLSEWQQIRLLDQCLKFDYELLENISTWLASDNDGVAIFGLRLARHLNQYQELEQIIKLLYHRNPEVQFQAIETCVELSATNSLENLYEIYELTKNIKVKRRVLKALGELGDAKEVGFLREVVFNEKHYDLTLEAARSIKRLGRNDLLKESTKSLTPQNKGIVNHILDDRI